MQLNHLVPFDNVELEGFASINHSSISTIFLSLEDVRLACPSDSIRNLGVDYPTAYIEYGVSYTTRRQNAPPRSETFTFNGTVVNILHDLYKDLPDGTTMYLFGYDEGGKDLPHQCPPPPETPLEKLKPRLIAVMFKT